MSPDLQLFDNATKRFSDFTLKDEVKVQYSNHF
jgi:hypothetical protein